MRTDWERYDVCASAARRVSLVILTGMDDESMAARALQEGAQDYLIKGQIRFAFVCCRSLRYAIERKTMEEALFVEKERAQVTLNCDRRRRGLRRHRRETSRFSIWSRKK